MKNLFNRFVREEVGQDLIEYTLLAACIALGCTVAMKGLATTLSTKFAAIGTAITTP